MIDVKLLREVPDLVKQNIARRKDDKKLKLVDKAIIFDKGWRESLQKLEKLKHEKNLATKKIASSGKSSKVIFHVKNLKKQIIDLTNKNEGFKKNFEEVMLRIPNLLHESVPFGEDEHDNVEVKRWGRIPKRDFKPKNHLQLLLDLGLIDNDRAAKVSGNAFFYLIEELALLDMAIQRYAIDFLRKRGFKLVYPPHILRRKSYEGVTDVADFKDVMYKIEGEDAFLIATAEHPLGARFINETLLEQELPLKFVGYSTNFRKEVGTHGKYTKGLFRMHHFNKIEQFVFCKPEDSWKLHEEIQKNCEELYQELGLPYRVVNNCTGDIGIVAAKKYDTEMLMADGEYREIGSNSNCTDYQARRLGVKYREGVGKPPKDYVHTLNNTALATSRTMVAIIETYQQKDGSIKVPKVLQPYMNGLKVVKKKK
ncbi:MAG: serine--tRNA ligase [Nanoarchaeota archaeon]|nr:serine--tRNA ligase [Nanoarchaeota archaeon]